MSHLSHLALVRDNYYTSSDTLYIGQTNNLDKRTQEHQNKTTAKKEALIGGGSGTIKKNLN